MGSSTSFLAIVLIALTLLLLAVQGSSAFRSINRETIRQKAFGEHLSRTSTRKLLTVPPRPKYARCPAGALEGYEMLPPVTLFFCQDCITDLGGKVTVTKRTSGVPWPTADPVTAAYTNRTGSYKSCTITSCPKGMTLETGDDGFWVVGAATNMCRGTLPARILRMSDSEIFREAGNLCKEKLGTPLAHATNYYQDKYYCILFNFPMLLPICKTSNAEERRKLFKHLDATRPPSGAESDLDYVKQRCAFYRSLPGFDSPGGFDSQGRASIVRTH